MELVAAPFASCGSAAPCGAILTLLYADAASLADFVGRDTIDPG
jgi:hypothetical protein